MAVDKNGIVQTLRLLVKGKELIENLIMCTVVSVDGITCVCQPIDEGEAEILDVRLVSKASTTNFIITPAVDSIVGVLAFSDLETTEYMVVLFSEIDTINIRGDQFGGLVKVEDLVDRLNLVEQKVNGIISSYNTHIHPTPSGASSAPTVPISGTLTETVRGDIENEDVLHG